MPVDLQRQPDGRLHFSLGVVERWVATVVAAAVVSAAYWFAASVMTRMDKQNDTLQIVVTQQAVANGQIQTLSAQLADVPRMTRDITEMKVRVDRHEQDIKELRSMRGLR